MYPNTEILGITASKFCGLAIKKSIDKVVTNIYLDFYGKFTSSKIVLADLLTDSLMKHFKKVEDKDWFRGNGGVAPEIICRSRKNVLSHFQI